VREVCGLTPLVDDMLSTGGTVEAAVKALLVAGCVPEVTMVTSHTLLVGRAIGRLQALPLRQVVVTDSIAWPTGVPLPLHMVSLAPLLAEAIQRLHRRQALGDLIVHV
jgi:ribose-phosphate pyrophosphokinase